MHQIRTNVNPSVDLQIMQEPGKQITREMKLNRVARTRTETKPTTKTTTPTLLLTLAVVAVAVAFPAAAQDRGDGRGQTRVYTLDPSTHSFPEGIAYDKSTGAFFVGATGDGTIYRGTLDKPTITEFITGAPGKEATGMKVFQGRLYVAGGFSGAVSVYSIASRKLVASFQNFGAGMLNDLVVTKDGDVFITDSFLPTLWHVTGAQVAAGGGVPNGIRLDPEIKYDFSPFSFNLNGIVALKGGRSFIVVQSNNGKLFRIDLDQQKLFGREIHQISIEPLVNGDGLLLDGGDLLVVQGGPPAMVTFVRLNGKADGGSVVERRTDPSLRESSTIARARNFYLVVNPDFSNLATPFTVTGFPRNYDDDDE